MVERGVKTAFTKHVNKEVLPYAKLVKGRGGGAGGWFGEDLEALMGEGQEVLQVEEEVDDSVEKDAMVKVRTKAGKFGN